MRKITLAEHAGFCFGVDRAMNIINNVIDSEKGKIVTIGPIIHNPQVIAELEGRGVCAVDSADDVMDGEIAVIRTHGLPESAYKTLDNRKIKYYDTTCPFVSKIQAIAKKSSLIIIAGDPNHPEVKGIKGFANESIIVSCLSELEKFTEKYPFLCETECSAVAQTTFSKKEWKLISDYIRKNYTNAKVFDTICNATSARQCAAADLAEKCDAMVVIGGKNSSNTTKLYEICADICDNTYLVESADELPVDKLSRFEKIGVTAGASTPSAVIKEVVKTMSDIALTEGEVSFAEELEKSMLPLQNGDRVMGIVVSVTENEIQVDVSAKQSGYVVASEFSADPNINLKEAVKPGDELELLVVRVNDVEGTVMLSKKRIDAVVGYEKLQAALDSGEILDGVVTEVIKDSGVIVSCMGAGVFVPGSQSGVSRETGLDVLLRKNVKFKVIEIKQGRRRRIIGSIKKASREERGEKEQAILSQIEVGQRYDGVVKSITSFGAFVDIGGVDGLVHISELSWTNIKHPNEVVNVGDTVNVYIKNYDPETKRISLGYKNPDDNPFNIFNSKFAVGDIADVKIVRIVPFGAFAEIVPGVDGLIHISQISNERVGKVQDFLKVGETVKAKITEINVEKEKISLSIKATLENDTQETAEEQSAEESAE